MYVCSALHIQWRSNLPVVAGIFYALSLHIYGFVPPCRCLMARLPLSRCSATGKAEPFFYFRPANIFSYAQTYSEMFEREKYIPLEPSSPRYGQILLSSLPLRSAGQKPGLRFYPFARTPIGVPTVFPYPEKRYRNRQKTDRSHPGTGNP